MKFPCNFLLSSNTIFLMLLELLTCEPTCEDLPQSFTKNKKVPALSWKDIISNHSVRGELQCAFNCAIEKTCVGFKYKQYVIVGAMSPTVNCQLTNTTGRNMANYDDRRGWVFFYLEDTKELNYSNSTTEKEMTTTPGILTTEKEMTTTPGVSTTEKEMTTTSGIFTTEKEMTTTPGVSTIEKEMTTTSGIFTTEKEMTTTPGVSTTEKEMTTTLGIPTTENEMTTTPAIPTTEKEMTTTPAIPTTEKEMNTTPGISTTEKEMTTSSGIPTTEKEITTTPGIPTTYLPPCVGYTWLNDSSRNKNYSVREQQCDDGLSGWYRFGGGAGIKIATSCVHRARCGTTRSGWMNDTHPTVVEGQVIKRVCYTSHDLCCKFSNNIEVVNCGQYYVYKLSPPPTCNLRYCGSDN